MMTMLSLELGINLKCIYSEVLDPAKILDCLNNHDECDDDEEEIFHPKTKYTVRMRVAKHGSWRMY